MSKPCLDCGEPSTTSRCDQCGRAHETKRRPDLHRTNANRWQKLSKRLRRASSFCELCGTTANLTVDHILPYSERPDLEYELLNLRILCRRCNGARGDRVTDAERAEVERRLAEKNSANTRRVDLTPGGDDPRSTVSRFRGKAQKAIHTPRGYAC